MNVSQTSWPLRPWILAFVLGVGGLLLNWVIGDHSPLENSTRVQSAIAVFIVVSMLSFAFALERFGVWQTALFALVWGVLLGCVSYSTLVPRYSGVAAPFDFWSGLIAVTIAVPIFQTLHQQQAFKLPYVALHSHAWADVVSWFASWLFVGVSFVLAWLLAGLFDLIGIDQIKTLLRNDWFVSGFIGACFGASLGVLKENRRIVANLQNLVMTVLAILAAPLCISLLLFLIALPFVGLQGLWDATRGTTPILISCVLGALILINAVIRNQASEESQNRILRMSAFGLALCVFPLALIALISMYQRLDQYGLTPDRIWGMITVSIAVVYGLGYLYAALRRRHEWMQAIRNNNVVFALALMVITLFLAFPILDFAKASVDSQMKRYTSGEVSADNFDFVAFAYDFGEAGRAKLEELKLNQDSDLAAGAAVALGSKNRWSLQSKLQSNESNGLVISDLIVVPHSVDIPPALMTAIQQRGDCALSFCALIWEPQAEQAQLLSERCVGVGTKARGNSRSCVSLVAHLHRVGDEWKPRRIKNKPNSWRQKSLVESPDFKNSLKQRKVEVRTVERKQIFVGDRPFGEPFDDAPTETPPEPPTNSN